MALTRTRMMGCSVERRRSGGGGGSDGVGGGGEGERWRENGKVIV